jgi:hypothetical protein
MALAEELFSSALRIASKALISTAAIYRYLVRMLKMIVKHLH